MEYQNLLLFLVSIHYFVGIQSCGPECFAAAEEYRRQSLMSQMYHGLPDAPVPGTIQANASINPALLDVFKDRYDFVQENKPDMNSPNYISKFLIAEDPFGGEDLSNLIAYFPMKEDMRKYQIIAGTLLIATDMSHGHSSHSAIHVQVFEKNQDNSLGEMIASKTLKVNKQGRLYLDLPVSALNRWFTNPIGGLFVSAMHNGHNVAIHPQQETKDSDKMLLQVFFRNRDYDGLIRLQPNSTLSRSKRAVPKLICTLNDKVKNEGCCLYELIIDFAKIGWNWVISPPLYNAYMCRGNCHKNGVHIWDDNTHSKVMRSANEILKIPELNMKDLGYCCHPIEYDYLNMMYVNQYGDVITSTIQGMIASRCGCS